MDKQHPNRVLELKNVNKFYGDFHALKNINMSVNQGEKVVICGPSGSGKSTLIRCVNQLEIHNEGQVLINGKEIHGNEKNVDAIRSDVGMVFQSFNLFPHLTILQNLTLAPRLVRKVEKKQREKQAMDYLERVRIADQAHKYPSQLSGGQQQRVAIARALCMNPQIKIGRAHV